VHVAAAYGTLPRTATYDDGVLRWRVDPAGGQKTGAYLDQRVNHRLLGARARGRGLDLFAHHGGFGLHLLAGGADDVHLVDTSAHALEGALAAAKENGLPMPSVHRGDAAQHLRGLLRRGEQFDVISVDPPAFAKRARDLPRAEAAYKDVQLHAMRLLRPGGILAASSCSFHLSEPAFMNVLTDAATDAGRTFHVVERRGAAPDHVERLGFPESAYLKFVILQAVQG
jgi:23S rRNA (cytosine1962-C5)-methyltransferase